MTPSDHVGALIPRPQRPCCARPSSIAPGISRELLPLLFEPRLIEESMTTLVHVSPGQTARDISFHKQTKETQHHHSKWGI